MIRGILRRALELRGAVVVLAALLLGYAGFVAQRARLDVLPGFAPPQAGIQTEAPGMSPEQVEMRVTTPLEAAIHGVTGLADLRSQSIEGLSVVTAVFTDGTDPVVARQLLAERIAEVAGDLPAGVGAPRLTPLTSATMDLLKIGLVSDRLSPMELRTLADWTLRPRLLAVPGVAKCSVFGGEVRQLQVQVHPARLVAFGVSLGDVVDAARRATGVAGGGFIDTANQRLVIDAEGQADAAAVLARAGVAGGAGAPVRLGDVADVVEAPAPKVGDTLIQGGPGVLLSLSSQYGANTLEVTRRVEAALADLRPTLEKEGVTVLPALHRPAGFVETALANVLHSALLGALLVVAVLYAFLRSARTTLVSLVAIPLSLGTALIVLDALGATINVMTLGGLAIAVGEVVDDAIVDVENIVRRLRERREARGGVSLFRTVLGASLEVRGAVVYATFVVVLVFLPIATLPGLQGRFFAPLAWAYILAVLASLGVALTVTPALALLLLGEGRRPLARHADLARLETAYRRLLRRVARRPAPVVGVALGLLLLAAALVPSLGGGFLPSFREGHFVVQVSAAPGTSIEESKRVGRRIGAALLAIPGVATVEQQIGRAELSEDAWGPERSELHVQLESVSGREEARIARRIRATLDALPGLQSEVLTFLGDRIGETLSGETAPVVVNVFGNDLEAIDRAAADVARAMARVPGAEDVRLHAPPGAPRLRVALDPARLSARGVRPMDALATLRTAYQGEVVAQTFDGPRVTDVVVTLEPGQRSDPAGVGRLLLRAGDGAWVPLAAVAEVGPRGGRQEIAHEGGRRRRAVTCSVDGVPLARFDAALRRALADRVSLPAGVYLEIGGTAAARSRAVADLALHAGFAGVGIALLLFVAFRSARNVAVLLLNLPFALVGGILAAAATRVLGGSHAGLGLGGLVGFVTLFGITTRNGLLMMSRFEHRVAVDGRPWTLETAVDAASDRLRPILMTASVTGLALLPLALGSGEAGREIEGPMAVVILGGLASSTALNLLLLPLAALRFARFRPPSRG